MKRNRIIFLLLLGILFYIFLTPIDYYVIKPDEVSDLGQMVRIEKETRPSGESGFYMVTVKTREARILDYILLKTFKKLMPDTDIISFYDDSFYKKHSAKETFIPRLDIEDSKQWVKTVALSKVSYKIKITGEGAEVVNVMEDSPAKGILEPGDIITNIDGTDIKTAEDIIRCVTAKPIGVKCSVTIKRGDKIKTVTIKTSSHPFMPEKGAFRITITTHNMRTILPIDIDIDTGKIQGPSGEMMFALEIIDRLVPDDLTRGYKIAGTGTILDNTDIGSVEGIKQKVIAAERAGIDYFLVPQGNYDEALPYAKRMKIVAIKNLDEALNFLHYLKPKIE